MTTQLYRIGNMDCAQCAREVEDGVRSLAGVRSVRVDFATEKMLVEGDIAHDILQKRVEALGKQLLDATVTPAATRTSFAHYLLNRRETRFALVGGSLVLIGLLLSLMTSAPFIQAVVIAGVLIAVYPIATSALSALRTGRVTINLLMTIAALGAILIGETAEAALVITLFALGEALEGYTADRARDSLRSLVALNPLTAWQKTADSLREVPIEALSVGDTVLVKAGERVPMDGVVLEGSSAVNQASITGESLPVDKQPGADVFAGAINGEGTLIVRVTQLASNSTLARVIALVEQAQSQRATTQRLIDTFSSYYTPAVTLLALLIALVPPLLLNAPFYDTPAGHGWFYRALTLLVIACPCALVISTPVTLISALTAAARRGVLIKGGVHLETLAQLRTLVFDKTGTLTSGSLTIADIHTTLPERDFLQLIAALEAHSTHPIARAIVAHAQQANIPSATATEVQTFAGQGIQGRVGSRSVTVGKHAFVSQTLAIPAHDDALTTIYAHDGTQLLGWLTLTDAPRPQSASVIAALNALGIRTVLASGDHARTAHNIAEAVGIQAVYADLLPADKVRVIEELVQQDGVVGMVGDGINDTPALASANVGIAMGGAGSAQALETADVVLMSDDLSRLPYAVRLARFSVGIMRANIALSIATKLIFMALAIAGEPSLWIAILADVGMMLVVVLNGMRPLRLESD